MQLGAYHVTSLVSETIPSGVVTAKQVHKGKIIDVHEATRLLTEADGLVLRDEPFTIAVYTADCMPLVLIGEREALALHVSRKTILHQQLERANEVIGNILAAYVGPHICAEHFTFSYAGPELQQLQQQYPDACRADQGDMISVSLLALVQKFLLTQVASDNVYIDRRCTWEDSALPSYRRSLVHREVQPQRIFTLVHYEND